MEPGQSFLDRAIEQSDTVFKDDQTTTVARINIADASYVFKRYNPRSSWHRLKRAFRRSRARRCWSMSYHFQSAGLNVPEPVLMYEKRLGPIRRNAYFVNRLLGGDELLGLLPSMTAQHQESVVLAIRDAFRAMRLHRISHGDMKASNLLWVDGALFFIDLDAARKHLTKTGWRLAARKDRKRFRKNWLGQPDLLRLFLEI